MNKFEIDHKNWFEKLNEKDPEVVTEMKKLRDYLTEKGIEWTDNSTPKCTIPICRTRFYAGGTNGLLSMDMEVMEELISCLVKIRGFSK